jgi:hypothetical protein
VEVQDLNYGKVKELEKRAAHGEQLSSMLSNALGVRRKSEKAARRRSCALASCT